MLLSMCSSFHLYIAVCINSLFSEKRVTRRRQRGFLNIRFLAFPPSLPSSPLFSLPSIPYGRAARQECSAALRTLLILRASRPGSWCLSLSLSLYLSFLHHTLIPQHSPQLFPPILPLSLPFRLYFIYQG